MAKKLNLEAKDFTISELLNKDDKGKLITNPEYQRTYVYKDDKASKLIESALMKIPLPTIYLCEEDDGKYSVIDGQQRLVSFFRFLRNNYALRKLEVRSDLNGKFYKDLNEDDQTTIDDTALRTIIIAKESSDAKFDIFERLNRGAVSLREQELRNCVYRGPFNQLLHELAKNKRVIKLFISSNNRMSHEECILRFFALREFLTYKGSMKQHLNAYMAVHQNDGPDAIKEAKDLFNKTLGIIAEILGEDAFYNVDYIKKTFSAKFSPTFYDSIMIGFSLFDRNKLMANRDEIAKQIKDLKLTNDNYHIACYAGTGSKDRVITRIQTIINLLTNILGPQGLTKKPRLFDPALKLELWEKQNHICPICGQEIVNLEEAKIDHIKPYSHGGETQIENAQLTHGFCNLAKSDNEN